MMRSAPLRVALCLVLPFKGEAKSLFSSTTNATLFLVLPRKGEPRFDRVNVAHRKSSLSP